eukprot:CAMPEP_0204368620 /NCGR_PEP_ID=MMETSP0469-20131031/44328_1 /ASSEMBLY_ACC=CAM_ASM_000384 /TAXON_ID=2969 /ORGANISM="Oxyrrhis marina" /LENGTH=128 /DNA_ID=CAMNT_0051358211 /DNA_START=8 /DNA_END=394 /DNA_ORIENTATION=+
MSIRSMSTGRGSRVRSRASSSSGPPASFLSGGSGRVSGASSVASSQQGRSSSSSRSIGKSSSLPSIGRLVLPQVPAPIPRTVQALIAQEDRICRGTVGKTDRCAHVRAWASDFFSQRCLVDTPHSVLM